MLLSLTPRIFLAFFVAILCLLPFGRCTSLWKSYIRSGAALIPRPPGTYSRQRDLDAKLLHVPSRRHTSGLSPGNEDRGDGQEINGMRNGFVVHHEQQHLTSGIQDNAQATASRGTLSGGFLRSNTPRRRALTYVAHNNIVRGHGQASGTRSLLARWGIRGRRRGHRNRRRRDGFTSALRDGGGGDGEGVAQRDTSPSGWLALIGGQLGWRGGGRGKGRWGLRGRRGGESGLAVQEDPSPGSVPRREMRADDEAGGRRLLLIVTPTYVRAAQSLYLLHLGNALRAVAPPVLWIVVEARGKVGRGPAEGVEREREREGDGGMRGRRLA